MSHKTRNRGGKHPVNNIFEHLFGGFWQAIGWMLGTAAVSVLVGVVAHMSKGQGLMLLPVVGLDKAGCERIFEDKASGARDDRPGLVAAQTHLRKGDCLVVWK